MTIWNILWNWRESEPTGLTVADNVDKLAVLREEWWKKSRLLGILDAPEIKLVNFNSILNSLPNLDLPNTAKIKITINNPNGVEESIIENATWKKGSFKLLASHINNRKSTDEIFPLELFCEYLDAWNKDRNWPHTTINTLHNYNKYGWKIEFTN